MKANKDGWFRHRGGKCPVEAGALVDVRFRSGITKTVCYSTSFRWNHTGQQGDIMAYRPHVATTEQSSDVAQDLVTEGVKAEWEAKLAANPLQWRDRIHVIDAEQKAAEEAHKAATDARTAERAELVQKLAEEGLALIVKVDADDMIDPRNWKRGDVVECVSDYSNQFTRGKFYTLRSDYREEEYSVKIFKDDTGDTFNGWNPENFKWHSRPTA